jgi:hypothetical protein
MKMKAMNVAIVALSDAELDQISGGGTCGQDVGGAVAAAVGVVGVIAAPVTMGASLAAAALFGLAAGIYAGKAAQSCNA